jgi:hypothetical protein
VVFGTELLNQWTQDLRQRAGPGLAGSTRARSQGGKTNLFSAHAKTTSFLSGIGDDACLSLLDWLALALLLIIG